MSNKLNSKYFKTYLSKKYKNKKSKEKITSDEIMAFALANEYNNNSLCSSGAVSPLANVSYFLAKASCTKINTYYDDLWAS